MYTNIKKLLLTVFSVILACSTTASAAEKTISLVSNSSNAVDVVEAEPFTVQVTVDDASEIAGAAFTVTYDTTNLTLDKVDSSFFGTFIEQGIDTSETEGYVTVESVDYYSPLVSAPATNGSMLAAARFDNGSGTDAVLFTLTFSATGSSGTYPISVSQSVINNTDAGYDADGETIPFFVGIDGDTYSTHTVPTINALNVTVSAIIVDTDDDDIDDNWEITYRPDGVNADDSDVLDYYTATGDYDRDGYSDLQEYMNWSQGIADPDGADFDPAAKNAADGTGYVAIRIALPAVNLLLLTD